MTSLKNAIFLCACAVVVSPALACYTVYGTANQVLYTGYEPPIDMSYQIHQRLPSAFPGGHMVFGNSTDCTSTDTRAAMAGTAGGMALTTASAAAPAAAGKPRATAAR